MLHLWERISSEQTTLDTSKAYSLWAPNYPPYAHNELMELDERAILEMLPNVKGRSALDLACGTGRYLNLLIARGASIAVGVDASTAMLTRARLASSNIARADMLSLCLRALKFDVVICALAVGHVKRLGSALSEISRVLTPGGTVIYSDMHPLGSWLGWKRTFRGEDGRQYAVRHYTHFYSQHVAACKAARLQIEAVREPVIDFTSKWRGYPALLVIKARKEG